MRIAANNGFEADFAPFCEPVRRHFESAFPAGPTPAQRAAWPIIAAGEHLLLISPTGTGKTLAAFLAIVDRLIRESLAGATLAGLRCVYVSPLRSLGYDVERNLNDPLEAIRRRMGAESPPVRVAVRTGDTSANDRRKQRDAPPQILITTPESLALLLSQRTWDSHWKTVEHLIVDEVHALAPNKRGADLAISLERLADRAATDPIRIGLSATCRPAEAAARYLAGVGRPCRTIDLGLGAERSVAHAPDLDVETLIAGDEAPHRGLTYRRLLRRLGRLIAENRTTVVFANTRAFAETLTHDLRRIVPEGETSVAAHHSALDSDRRRTVEASLKAGELRAVVTSTSLELGVDIGTADATALVGLPGSIARCLQRVGRSGHQVGAVSRGVFLAASPAELAGAAVTAEAARRAAVEPLRPLRAPLDVLCQQLVGMACAGEWSCDGAFDLVRRTAPMESLSRADFDACLAYLAGDLAAPSGAYEPEPGAVPRWTAPRLWRERGRFGLRNSRVLRWYRRNVGTITSEESVRVQADGVEIGTLEGAYAERLQKGDRFVLDGRALEFRRMEGLTVLAKSAAGEPDLPRWTSDRQSLSPELAAAVAAFREHASRLVAESPSALRAWLRERYELGATAAGVLVDLFTAQERRSEVPRQGTVLVEESPHEGGLQYAFHVPLARSACEALGRAAAARLGRSLGRDLSLVVGDLGFAVRTSEEIPLTREALAEILHPRGFADDVLEGVDRGDLPARRFRHIAATGLMVLRNPEGGRARVGGLLWVSRRLYPLVKAACPDHPLLRETRREVLHDLLDADTALSWLEGSPALRLRRLDGPSPFTAAWIDPASAEPLRFESAEDALRRLHRRLVGATEEAGA